MKDQLPDELTQEEWYEILAEDPAFFERRAFEDELARRKTLQNCNSIKAVKKYRELIDSAQDAALNEDGYDDDHLLDFWALNRYQLLSKHYDIYFESLVKNVFDGAGSRGTKLSVQGLLSSYEYILHESKTEEIPGRTALDWLSHFVEIGIVPPPEILVAVADSFNQYLDAGGSVTLEQSFFDYKKTGKQNYAKTSQTHGIFKQFHQDVIIEFTPNEQYPPRFNSLSELARDRLDRYRLESGKVLSDDEYEDFIDSFLRGYRRWKKKQSADI
jgi:hypothetical protein